jgi:inner membrane protein
MNDFFETGDSQNKDPKEIPGDPPAWLKNHVSVPSSKIAVMLKMMMIGFLSLLLLIPMGMVQGVINEREQNSLSATADISRAWGGNQVVTGPILSVPYRRNKQVHTLHLLPKKLHITANLKPEVRARGIFKSVVYNSKLDFQGMLNLSEANQVGHIDPKTLDWGHAIVSVGISDIRGIQELSPVQIHGKTLSFEPSAQVQGLYSSGIHIPLPVAAGVQEVPFSFSIQLRGSETLQFVPVGADTRVNMSSNWQHPSFIGQFLPVDRTVEDSGFKAAWRVNRFARNFPQVWTDETASFPSGNYQTTNYPGVDVSQNSYQSYSSDSARGYGSRQTANILGVSLLQPIDAYRESTRSAKYAILFLGLTFLTYFLLEVTLGARVHAFQYLLVGLALCLFYLLLVSISEFISFTHAYLVAAGGTITLVTAYTGAIVHKRRVPITLGMGSLLSLLYVYLYVLLQLEDMALLFGSIGLFLILAAVMFVTRRIDWYAER